MGAVLLYKYSFIIFALAAHIFYTRVSDEFVGGVLKLIINKTLSHGETTKKFFFYSSLDLCNK